MPKVWLDFGHGGSDSGATNAYTLEKIINLVVGLEVKRLLLLNGFQVGTSRETDVFVDLTKRCNMANSWGADSFWSIHHNACGSGASGAETIYSITGGESQKMAQELAAEFAALGQHIHRVFSRLGDGGKDYYAVIRQTNMAACIGEYGFMDSSDYANFDTNEELLNEAKAWARAICKHYNIKFIEQVLQPAPEPIVVPESPKEVKPMETLNFEESLQLLKEKCGIDPEHWRQANDSVKYIEELFVKIANTIK
jgi:N-acetylmuramoyl-L-alanine amidase